MFYCMWSRKEKQGCYISSGLHIQKTLDVLHTNGKVNILTTTEQFLHTREPTERASIKNALFVSFKAEKGEAVHLHLSNRQFKVLYIRHRNALEHLQAH